VVSRTPSKKCACFFLFFSRCRPRAWRSTPLRRLQSWCVRRITHLIWWLISVRFLQLAPRSHARMLSPIAHRLKFSGLLDNAALCAERKDTHQPSNWRPLTLFPHGPELILWNAPTSSASNKSAPLDRRLLLHPAEAAVKCARRNFLPIPEAEYYLLFFRRFWRSDTRTKISLEYWLYGMFLSLGISDLA